ncbi:MAG TPA: coproporphyrinogen III oxidase, partial [Bacteroidales bacterium]|nr:coproporphyrinogen III oxidase [Bacteroidales bacterium]
SFFERDLKWMNRRHSVEKAVESIRFARKHGFENINIDLIYGLPGLSKEDWRYNLERFFELDIPHLSAYHLTIEPRTVFGVRKKRGQLKEISEDASVAHFEILIEEMARRGYLHYEISNFAREGYLSKHNLSYWKNDLYLGAGPSAHSYDGNSRRWNTKLHNVYISNLANGEKYFDEEDLTEQDRFNDYVLTNLRTMWGIDLATIDNNFGEFYTREVEKTAAKYKAYLIQNNGTITLNDKGKFIADRIASEFFSIENL